MRSMFVHISNTDGHRRSYQTLFLKLLGGTGSSGRIRGARFWRLVRAPKVFFATIDDDYFGFAAVALVRMAIFRPTMGLFLRPQQCFQNDRKIVYFIKRYAFKIIRKIPKITVMLIVPIDVHPNYEEIADDWIYDPQLWDLTFEKKKLTPPETEISKRIERERGSKKVLSYIGHASNIKGFDIISDAIIKNPDVAKDLLFVVGGKISEECTLAAKKLEEMGMIVINRYVTDQEILSIYGATDLVWCCYDVNYDQASGIFGRAIQMQRLTVVRKGSIIDKTSEMIGVEPIKWDSTLSPGDNLKNIFSERSTFDQVSSFDAEKLYTQSISKVLSKL
jgi:hypothetical protein